MNVREAYDSVRIRGERLTWAPASQLVHKNVACISLWFRERIGGGPPTEQTSQSQSQSQSQSLSQSQISDWNCSKCTSASLTGRDIAHLKYSVEEELPPKICAVKQIAHTSGLSLRCHLAMHCFRDLVSYVP